MKYKVGDAFIDLTGLYGIKNGIGILISIDSHGYEVHNLVGTMDRHFFPHTLDVLVEDGRFLWIPKIHIL